MIKRPLPVIGCAYLISLAVVFLFTSFSGRWYRPEVLPVISVVVPIAVCLGCAFLRPSKNVLRVVLLCCVAFTFGVLYSAFRTVTIPSRITPLYEQKAMITARLDDTAGTSGSRYHYVVTTKSIAVYDPATERYVNDKSLPQAVRMRLTVPAPLDATYGDTLTAEVNITQPYPVANNSPYVIRDADGIMAFSYAYGDIAYQSPERYSLLAQLRSLRDRVNTAIARAVGGDAGLVSAAILTGDKNGVPQTVIRSFRASGLSHLLAVSGLHVTILMQFLLALLTLLRCPRRISAALCLLALLLFAAFTGFTASVVRACIMASAQCVAKLFRRRYDALNSIAFSALIICIVNPAALLSLSFVLSFAATLAILVLAPALDALCKRYLPWLWQRAQWAVQGATLSISATLFTYPVIAAVFGEVSLIGPVVNVLVIPFVPALTVLTLLTGIAGVAGISALAQALGFCTRIIMLVVLRISDFFGALDFAWARVTVIAVCLITALFLLCVVAVRLIRRKTSHIPELLILTLLPVCIGVWFAYTDNSLDVIIAFPDSSVSQTAVVHQAGHAAIIAGTDTKNRASGAAYYLTDNALIADLLLTPCLTDSAAVVVRETTKRAEVAATLIADDTIRSKELLRQTEGANLLKMGDITTHVLLDDVVCYVDKREKNKAAVFLTANDVSVLFLYSGANAARLPAQFLSPDVCVISGRMPENIDRIKAKYYILSEALAAKHAKELSNKVILSPDGDNPLRLHCSKGGGLRLEDTTIDVYR